ncbi:type II secretion system F family protein [Chelativorans sp. AA-79]|uniref:type II secretion system F family protein n=1 Tax=Chelativorans sp. AA-79 TaxID=3028735 RepID=UPI0023FA1319|nr:type II secretion system F family protein [Chelativorans sp. AA-79]WEX09338.1 type II secretion system F family protein [Chelativorans sp. AA-79]
MFGMSLSLLAFILLAAGSAGALAYALMFNTIASEKKVERRLETVKRAETDGRAVRVARDRAAEVAKRRRSIQETLKDLEAKQKDRERFITRPPLKIQIRQAGLEIGIQRFYILSGIAALLLAVIIFILGAPLLAVGGAAISGFFGLPRWIVAYLRKRRVKAFLSEFPNALDIIVRAVRSGLPLNDAVRMIASEAQEPVRTEFRRLVESQQLGLPMAEAAMRMSETMPCPEVNFFGIVIQIQTQAGGNLSEALGNLSRVLRERKKMKAKVQALSMEAKASAVIIGALPIVVAVLVYITSPAYIMPLFTESIGHLILGVSAVWMSIGIFVMRQMMNFEV